MPVDTRDKRAASLMIALPFSRVLPDPDGAIVANNRRQLAYSYLIAVLRTARRGLGRALTRGIGRTR